MPQPSPRPVEQIDADLRSCRVPSRAAEAELAEVRRRQAELVEQEAALLAAIEMRAWRVDRLLDERLRAVGPTGHPVPAVVGQHDHGAHRVAGLEGRACSGAEVSPDRPMTST